MRRLLLPVTIAFFILLSAFALIKGARGQGPGGWYVLNSESQGENVREISAPDEANAPQQPDISFIDSPSVACYQPDPGLDDCYLNWYYLSVNASPNYMIAMTVTVNTIGVVARIGGFFQTSMYTPYNMFDRGFKVACGAAGSGGYANLGNAYAWTINARDSSNLKSANYGTAYCPPYPH